MIEIISKLNNEIEKNEKLRWNIFYKIIKVSADELYITHGIKSMFSFSVVDKFNLGILGEVADLLQSFISIEEISKRLNLNKENEIYLTDILVSLYKNGIIQKEKETLSFCYSVYYDNFSFEKFSESKIGIVGCGPLGIRNFVSLVSMGIRKINVLWGKEIAKEHMKLFPLFLQDNIEHSETPDKLIEKILINKKENPKIGFVGELNKNNLMEVLKQSDIVLISAENYYPRLFYEINELAHQIRTAIIYTFIDGGMGVLGPLIIPGETACFTCFSNALEASVLNPSYFTTYKSYMEKASIGMTTLSGGPPLYDILSGFTIDSIIRYFADCHSTPIINRIIILNFEAMEIDVQDILKNPCCPICSQLKPPLMGPTIT